MSEYCNNHERRISEVGHLIVDALIVKTAIEDPESSGAQRGCWACALTEDQFCRVLTEAATMQAKADAYGGSYTTGKVSLGKGSSKP